jgi:hypothetical protein
MFESHPRHECKPMSASFCIALSCVGTGLEMDRTPVQETQTDVRKTIRKDFPKRSRLRLRYNVFGLVGVRLFYANDSNILGEYINRRTIKIKNFYWTA